MGWLVRVLNKLDSFISWWERLVPSSWNKAGVGVIGTYLFGYWALLAEQPPVVVATCALGVGTFFVILFTHLPPLLKKHLSPSLLVIVHPAKFSSKFSSPGERQISIFIVNIPIFIINRSKHDRVHLELIVYVPLSNGKKIQSPCRWFLNPNSNHNFTPTLGPQETTGGSIHCTLNAPPDGSSFLSERAYLHIMDHVSARSLDITIPGRFPPEERY
jgi:hypothetical protein